MIIKINDFRGDLSGISAEKEALGVTYPIHVQKQDHQSPVLLFSKLNGCFFWYFNPGIIFQDTKNTKVWLDTNVVSAETSLLFASASFSAELSDRSPRKLIIFII